MIIPILYSMTIHSLNIHFFCVSSYLEITIQNNMKVASTKEAALAQIIQDSPTLAKLIRRPRGGSGKRMSSVITEVWIQLPPHLKSVPTFIYEGCRDQVIYKEFGDDAEDELKNLASSISGDLFFRAAFIVS